MTCTKRVLRSGDRSTLKVPGVNEIRLATMKISRSVRASSGTPIMPGRLICAGVITSHNTRRLESISSSRK